MLGRVTAKLHTMRKAQTFTVQPMSDGRIIAQSDKRIVTFDPGTRKGVLSTRGNSFAHLHPIMGAIRYDVSEDFAAQCLAVLPKPGGSTDLGGVTVQHTVQVIS